MSRNPQEVKDKFFIIENGRYVIVEHFNYEFVRNSLLKRYRKGSNERYMITVILREKTAVSDWDVRNMDLLDVYFSNERLRVQELMISDIEYENYRYQPNMPVPAVMERWMQYERNKNVQIDEMASLPAEAAAIPEKVYIRQELSTGDHRLPTISKMFPEQDAMKVLDWVVNYETAMHEVSNETSALATEQLRINSTLQQCSDFVNNEVTVKISNLMREMFPDERGFFGKLFGSDMKYSLPDAFTVQAIDEKLKKILTVDTNKFRGAEVWFDNLIERYEKHLAVLEASVNAGEYQLAVSPNDELQQYRYDRVGKMKITTNISLMTVQTAKTRFHTEMEKFQEIKDVLVPILINKLQVTVSGEHVVDEETTNLITDLRTLAERAKKSAKNDVEVNKLMNKE